MPTVKTLSALLSLLSLAALADGNDSSNTPGATPVFVTASQAATDCVESNVAAAAQAVATVPARAGQFFYVTNIEVTLIAIAAPVATLMATTSSNLPGAFSVRQAVQAVVGTQTTQIMLNLPLKASVANTAVVLTGPTGLANVSQNIRVCGFYAK